MSVVLFVVSDFHIIIEKKKHTIHSRLSCVTKIRPTSFFFRANSSLRNMHCLRIHTNMFRSRYYSWVISRIITKTGPGLCRWWGLWGLGKRNSPRELEQYPEARLIPWQLWTCEPIQFRDLLMIFWRGTERWDTTVTTHEFDTSLRTSIFEIADKRIEVNRKAVRYENVVWCME
jgi:hypothetical protein